MSSRFLCLYTDINHFWAQYFNSDSGCWNCLMMCWMIFWLHTCFGLVSCQYSFVFSYNSKIWEVSLKARLSLLQFTNSLYLRWQRSLRVSISPFVALKFCGLVWKSQCLCILHFAFCFLLYSLWFLICDLRFGPWNFAFRFWKWHPSSIPLKLCLSSFFLGIMLPAACLSCNWSD